MLKAFPSGDWVEQEPRAFETREDSKRLTILVRLTVMHILLIPSTHDSRHSGHPHQHCAPR